MHTNNSAHKRTISGDGSVCISDVENEKDATLGIKNLSPVEENVCTNNAVRFTKSEVCSFDPDIVHDLSTKIRTGTKIEHLTSCEEGLDLSVSSNSSKSNGLSKSDQNIVLSGECIEKAVEENVGSVQEPACSADPNVDANSKRCKGTVENVDNKDYQDDNNIVKDEGKVEIENEIPNRKSRPECKEAELIRPSNLIQSDENQKNNECIEKKPDLNSSDLDANLSEKEAEVVQDKNCLEKVVKKEPVERTVTSDSLLSKPGLSSDIEKQDLGDGNTFRCPECPWAFSSKAALQVHVTKKHKSKRQQTPTSEVSDYQNTRSKRSSVLYIRPKPFQCTKCQSSFHKRKELKEHSLCHTKQNHLVCQFCGLAFSKRKDLSDHLLYFHDQKQHAAFCELCGKTFSQAGNLKIHLRIHTKEKPYTCEHCGKCYAQSGDLKTHVRVHTDERPYLCEFCGNLFHSLSHLGRHSKVHTKEKPYTCLVCGHSFAHAHHLKKHYRIHTKEKPYNCDTCGKAFARSDYLKQHIRVHTKEKPYICKICGKGFSQGGSLRLHQRVHARQGIL